MSSRPGRAILVAYFEKEYAMRLYNYSHPLTQAQLDQLAIEWNIEAEDIEVTPISVQIEQSEPLLPQVEALLPTNYSIDTYIVLPGLAVVAALLTRELLSKYHFINIIRLRPTAGLITGYELAEIICLS